MTTPPQHPDGDATPESGPDIRVGLISPPDRDALVADILIDHEQFAEILHRDGRVIVEVSPRRTGEPWELTVDDLLAAVTRAAESLGEPRVF